MNIAPFKPISLPPVPLVLISLLSTVARHVKLCFPIIIVDCGDFNDTSSGVMTSPDYPNNYPDESICMVHVNLPTEYRVKVSVINSGGLSDCDYCDCDYIMVSVNL